MPDAGDPVAVNVKPDVRTPDQPLQRTSFGYLRRLRVRQIPDIISQNTTIQIGVQFENPIPDGSAKKGQEKGQWVSKYELPGIPTKKLTQRQEKREGRGHVWMAQSIYEKTKKKLMVTYVGWNASTIYEEALTPEFKEENGEIYEAIQCRDNFLKAISRDQSLLPIARRVATTYMWNFQDNVDHAFWAFEDLTYFHSRIQKNYGLPEVFYVCLRMDEVEPPKFQYSTFNIVCANTFELYLRFNIYTRPFDDRDARGGGPQQPKRRRPNRGNAACEKWDSCVCNKRYHQRFSFPDRINLEPNQEGLLNFPEILPRHRASILIECSDACGCSAQCPRRRLQKGQTKRLVVFYENRFKGFGLRAAEAFETGEFICEMVGVVKGCEPPEEKFDKDRHGFEVFDPDMVIVTSEIGNLARFIQFVDVDPNAILIETFSRVRETDPLIPRLSVYALKPVAIGDRITVINKKRWINQPMARGIEEAAAHLEELPEVLELDNEEEEEEENRDEERNAVRDPVLPAMPILNWGEDEEDIREEDLMREEENRIRREEAQRAQEAQAQARAIALAQVQAQVQALDAQAQAFFQAQEAEAQAFAQARARVQAEQDEQDRQGFIAIGGGRDQRIADPILRFEQQWVDLRQRLGERALRGEDAMVNVDVEIQVFLEPVEPVQPAVAVEQQPVQGAQENDEVLFVGRDPPDVIVLSSDSESDDDEDQEVQVVAGPRMLDGAFLAHLRRAVDQEAGPEARPEAEPEEDDGLPRIVIMYPVRAGQQRIVQRPVVELEEEDEDSDEEVEEETSDDESDEDSDEEEEAELEAEPDMDREVMQHPPDEEEEDPGMERYRELVRAAAHEERQQLEAEPDMDREVMEPPPDDEEDLDHPDLGLERFRELDRAAVHEERQQRLAFERVIEGFGGEEEGQGVLVDQNHRNRIGEEGEPEDDEEEDADEEEEEEGEEPGEWLDEDHEDDREDPEDPQMDQGHEEEEEDGGDDPRPGDREEEDRPPSPEDEAPENPQMDQVDDGEEDLEDPAVVEVNGEEEEERGGQAVDLENPPQNEVEADDPAVQDGGEHQEENPVEPIGEAEAEGRESPIEDEDDEVDEEVNYDVIDPFADSDPEDPSMDQDDEVDEEAEGEDHVEDEEEQDEGDMDDEDGQPGLEENQEEPGDVEEVEDEPEDEDEDPEVNHQVMDPVVPEEVEDGSEEGDSLEVGEANAEGRESSIEDEDDEDHEEVNYDIIDPFAESDPEDPSMDQVDEVNEEAEGEEQVEDQEDQSEDGMDDEDGERGLEENSDEPGDVEEVEDGLEDEDEDPEVNHQVMDPVVPEEGDALVVDPEVNQVMDPVDPEDTTPPPSENRDYEAYEDDVDDLIDPNEESDAEDSLMSEEGEEDQEEDQEPRSDDDLGDEEDHPESSNYFEGPSGFWVEEEEHEEEEEEDRESPKSTDPPHDQAGEVHHENSNATNVASVSRRPLSVSPSRVVPPMPSSPNALEDQEVQQEPNTERASESPRSVAPSNDESMEQSEPESEAEETPPPQSPNSQIHLEHSYAMHPSLDNDPEPMEVDEPEEHYLMLPQAPPTTASLCLLTTQSILVDQKAPCYRPPFPEEPCAKCKEHFVRDPTVYYWCSPAALNGFVYNAELDDRNPGNELLLSAAKQLGIESPSTSFTSQDQSPSPSPLRTLDSSGDPSTSGSQAGSEDQSPSVQRFQEPEMEDETESSGNPTTSGSQRSSEDHSRPSSPHEALFESPKPTTSARSSMDLSSPLTLGSRLFGNSL